MQAAKIILASQSQTRIKLLQNAGLDFTAMSARVSEETLKQDNPQLSPTELAKFLARRKALSVATNFPDQWVIGADQTLSLEGQTFNKAQNQAEACEHLKALRGKIHRLHSAICIARGEKTVFQHVETASLTMRNFSDDFLNDYLDRAGTDILHSVGCYHYEGLGIQLFEKVEGDYSTILGLPLLPLLAFLRKADMVAS